MTTTVVNIRTHHCDVYVGRPSGWGNPFEIGKDGTREEVIQKYREWIVQRPELLAKVHELKDKSLGCWCAPQPCHGDVLKELADTGHVTNQWKVGTVTRIAGPTVYVDFGEFGGAFTGTHLIGYRGELYKDVGIVEGAAVECLLDLHGLISTARVIPHDQTS